MRVLQTNNFKKSVKKLQSNEKIILDTAVCAITSNPSIGVQKVGDLVGVQVYKFHIVNKLTLLAYLYDELASSITLLSLGSHENFYRDLKTKI